MVLAAYSMGKEGLDVAGLDALLVARSDCVQACGRVLHGNSKNRILVDGVDRWSMGKAEFTTRSIY